MSSEILTLIIILILFGVFIFNNEKFTPYAGILSPNIFMSTADHDPHLSKTESLQKHINVY